MLSYFCFSNGMSDHAHSDTVYFHSLGLGKKDEVTKDKWILKTFSSVRKDLNHSEVTHLLLPENLDLNMSIFVTPVSRDWGTKFFHLQKT